MSKLRPTKSTLREALDVMKVGRSGRPMADLIRMIARLGSTISETACVLDIHAEKLIDIVEGRDKLTHTQADICHAYLLFLWWQHTWRSGYKEAARLDAIKEARKPLDPLWERMPQMSRRDWSIAYREANPER